MSENVQKTILLAEDEAIISMTEKMQLEKYGYAVKTVNTGEKAVEAVKTMPEIDLVLMDINLGNGIDGTQAAQMILNDRDVPIVFVSSHTEPDIVEKTERITSYGYVVKSSSITVLDASIKMAFKLFDANAKTKASEAKYHAVVENSNDGIMFCDSGATILYRSSSDKAINGFENGECLSHNIFETVHPDDVETVRKAWASTLGCPELVARTEYRIRHKDGSWKWIESTYKNLLNAPEVKAVVVVTRDIHEKKEIQNALKESELQYRHLFDSFPASVLLIGSDRRVIAANQASALMYGYESPEQLKGFDTRLLIAERDRERAAGIQTTILEGQKASIRHYTELRRDGSEFEAEIVSKTLYGPQQEVLGYIGITRDISSTRETEKALAESKIQFRLALENAPIPIMIRTDDGKVDFINAVWKELTGYTEEDIPTVEDWMKRAYGEKHSEMERLANGIYFEQGPKDHGDYPIRTKTGDTLIWDFATASLGKLADGRMAVITMAKDVTDRRHDEEAIKKLLVEKELLLRDVNHRTKNNLNLIYSLLLIQAATTKDPLAVTALEEAASRVQAIQDLYVLLVEGGDHVALHSGDYFPRLIDGIMEGAHHIPITVEKKIEDFVIGMRELPPLGLIVNELLTNAMKHAFTGRSEGKVTIDISKREDQATIVIRDDGVGIPESINLEKTTGFGFMMIKGLVQQIDGSISIERGAGTTFRIDFKLKE